MLRKRKEKFLTHVQWVDIYASEVSGYKVRIVDDGVHLEKIPIPIWAANKKTN